MDPWMDYLVRFASTAKDRDLAFELRRAVFETEQNVPRPLDRDAHDANADHVVVFDPSGRCVGTGRAVRLDARTCQIGRMATSSDHRKHGVGAKVLEALEHIAALRGLAEIVVHAQLPAESFYRKRGYVADGAPFKEEGVPHVRMRKLLVRQ
jgi:predicted GNAT family N-acyltransferase